MEGKPYATFVPGVFPELRAPAAVPFRARGGLLALPSHGRRCACPSRDCREYLRAPVGGANTAACMGAYVRYLRQPCLGSELDGEITTTRELWRYTKSANKDNL